MSSLSVRIAAPGPVADLPVDGAARLLRAGHAPGLAGGDDSQPLGLIGAVLGSVAVRAVWSLADEELLDRVAAGMRPAGAGRCAAAGGGR